MRPDNAVPAPAPVASAASSERVSLGAGSAPEKGGLESGVLDLTGIGR